MPGGMWSTGKRWRRILLAESGEVEGAEGFAVDDEVVAVGGAGREVDQIYQVVGLGCGGGGVRDCLAIGEGKSEAGDAGNLGGERNDDLRGRDRAN